MSFYTFKKHIKHIFLNNELILLDIKKDKYYFFNLNESLYLKNLLTTENLLKDSKNQTFLENFCQVTTVPENLNNIDNISGIDNYSWNKVKNQFIGTTGKLSFSDKIIIIKFYLIIFQDPSLENRLKKFEKAKETLKESTIISKDIINSAIKFIHDISIYFPYYLKCLEYSLILGLFLLHKKQVCYFHIGIQKYNFLAHAWIERDNEVIGDSQFLKTNLAILYKT